MMFFVSDLFSQNNIPLFLLVFFKIGIGNHCLGIVWSGFSLSGLVQGPLKIDMDNPEWKEAQKILHRHEEITQANSNALLHISSKITELEQASITNVSPQPAAPRCLIPH
jgi:hypothetical protein